MKDYQEVEFEKYMITCSKYFNLNNTLRFSDPDEVFEIE